MLVPKTACWALTLHRPADPDR